MNRIIILIFLCLIYLLVFCDQTLAEEQKKYKILIMQHQTLESYSVIIGSFIEKLKDHQNFIISRYNADGDLNAFDVLLKQTNTNFYDLIFAVGSIAAQKVLAFEKQKPVLVSGISSPSFLLENTNQNVAGAEVQNPTLNSLLYLYQFLKWKKMGMIYIENDVSHESIRKECQDVAQQNKTVLVSESIKNRDAQKKKLNSAVITKQIESAMNKVLSQNVDIFFIQLSKTFYDHFETINYALMQHHIMSVGDQQYLGLGITISISTNYHQKGLICADYAEKILLHDIKPMQLPLYCVIGYTMEYDVNMLKTLSYNPSLYFLLNSIEMQKGQK